MDESQREAVVGQLTPRGWANHS